MLLRFNVGNHLSIKDEQALTLVASSLDDPTSGLIDCPPAGGPVVPAAVIYGPNASGKSNFISALRFMRAAILYSHSRGQPDEGVPREPFALDPETPQMPTVIDADFVVDGTRYHYGFEASNEAFTSEWLYSFPNGRRQALFNRKDKEFRFSRNLKGRIRVISELVRPNSLFLSTAVQNGHEELSKVASFFRHIYTDTEISVSGGRASAGFVKADPDRRIVEFLNKIGTGIVDFRRKETEISEERMLMEREIRSLLEKVVKTDAKDLPAVESKRFVFQFGHRGRGKQSIYLDMDDESAGTRRLLVLLSLAFRVLDRGGVLIIDELDASLHTQACEAVLAFFCLKSTNPKGAQLVATTHDTNLLASPLLRRDQIWFTEKDTEGSTHLYPLTDIRTRRGDNVEKGYLQGRFGALPFSGSITDLLS